MSATRARSAASQTDKGVSLKRIGEVLGIITAIITVGGFLLAGLQFLLHGSIFYNATSTHMSRYQSDVKPALENGNQFVTEHLTDLKKDDPELFEKLIKDFARDNKLHSKLSMAVATSESIIACHQDYFCKFDGYESVAPDFRSLWFNFRPVLLEMRGSTEKKDFAMRLEEEAKRILKQDREAGTSPQ